MALLSKAIRRIRMYLSRVLPLSMKRFLATFLTRRGRLYWRYLFSRFMRRLTDRPSGSIHQEILTFQSGIELGPTPELPATFSRLGYQFMEGYHALYLHDESGIRSINPELLDLYPRPFGLKILKSQDFSADGTPYYISSDAASPVVMRAVGSLLEKMYISNILSLRGVAPRVYDVIELQSGDSVVFALVVRHVEGEVVTGDAACEFMEKFERVLEEEGIDILGGTDRGDFRPPDFKRNIVADATGTYYVDIQNFAILSGEAREKREMELVGEIQAETHFGGGRPFRPSRYAYQSAPELSITGKRDSLRRFTQIERLLSRHRIAFQGSTVLDVGCNLGVLLMYALSEGARWGIGLDRPEITRVARRYLFERNFSRFDLIGCDLRESDVARLLPRTRYDLALYMSVERHIGFPDWLDALSIRFFLYEGHQGESLGDISGKVKDWSPGIEILAGEVTQDGDSEPRPMLLGRMQDAHP